jgi:arylsulfatase A-like enzyme
VHEYIVGMFTDTQRMICDERWKYVTYPQAGREQLFDLESDPHELRDLSASAEGAGELERLKTRLTVWRRENGDPLEP